MESLEEAEPQGVTNTLLSRNVIPADELKRAKQNKCSLKDLQSLKGRPSCELHPIS